MPITVHKFSHSGAIGQQPDGGMPSHMNSFYGANSAENAMVPAMGGGGERVRVAMRVRPLMPHELNRGDENIITVPDA